MMTKPVMLVALVACIIMQGAAYSAYGALNWSARQPNFDNISPSSVIIHTSLVADDSKENITASSSTNNGSNLFHNRTDSE
jgi:hypothetical protein